MAFAAVVLLQSASPAGRGGFGRRAVVVGVRSGGGGALALSFSAATRGDERAAGASNDVPLRARRIAVVGGGASGIFAAIAAAARQAAANKNQQEVVEVTVLEATSKTLQKVKVSGGGRCNVLHDCRLPLRDYVASYPRGHQPLQGLFAASGGGGGATAAASTAPRKARRAGFGPNEAKEWFESRGVFLKTERDGRMFPVTDSSQTVMDCLLRECQSLGVTIQTGSKVVGVRWAGHDDPTMEQPSAARRPFLVDVAERRRRGRDAEVVGENEAASDARQTHEFDAIILATGSAPVGHRIASHLGHLVVPPVPSLFTLSTLQDAQPGGLLHGLAGLSLARAQVSFDPEAASEAEAEAAAVEEEPAKKKKAKRVEQEGPLLITHHGLSGPAALRLSAFGAIELNRLNYRTPLRVHWAPAFGTRDEIFEELWRQTSVQPKKLVRTVCPLAIVEEEDGATDNGESEDDGGAQNGGGFSTSAIPKRLWAALVAKSGLSDKTWAEAGKGRVRDLATWVAETELVMTGKGTFKEEFVTAGGIDLNQVDTRTMQSRIVPGFFACGECLNVDGVTGGFNFMNAWSTGYVAGSSAADFVMDSCHTMTADQETDT